MPYDISFVTNIISIVAHQLRYEFENVHFSEYDPFSFDLTLGTSIQKIFFKPFKKNHLLILLFILFYRSKNIRGILLTIIGVFNTGGSVLMYCGGLFSSYTAATSVGLVIALAFTFCVFFIPESPMFFVLKGIFLL